MESPEKALLSADILPPELDPEEGGNIDDAELRYEYLELVDNIGKEEFFEVYLNMINDIRQSSVENQIVLCNNILEKINEVYEFEFPIEVEINSKENVESIYEFLRFLEFEHIKFFSELWIRLEVDLKKIQVEKFCNQNNIKIINIIEALSDSSGYSELINLFLRTYNKDKIIPFIIEKTINSRMKIYLQIKFPELGVSSEKY